MSDWVDKCWGKTRELVDSPFYSKHELELEIGGYCSLHYHRHRANRFHVVSAQVVVVELYAVDAVRTMLGPDNKYDVPSLVPHLFLVYKPGVMIEEYFSDRGGPVERDDIIRIFEGGKVDDVKKLDALPLSILSKRLCDET